jgi:hypothetical protein
MSTSSKLISLNLKPGIQRESTQYAEKGAWYDGNKVRFRAGKPENIGGYETKVTATFNGAARDLITWSDNNQFKRAAFGTSQMLYEHNGDQIFDITPVSTSTTLASAFSCAISSNTVTVSATAHGRQTGDFVFFTSSTTIGGNILLGTTTYPVSVINSNTFALSVATTSSAAQSSAGGGTIHYLLGSGVDNAVTDLGYGAGSYNAGVSTAGARGWNSPTSVGASDFASQITQWSLDNFGEDIVANRRGSSIYLFDTDASTSPTRATLVSGTTNSTPTTVNSIIVSPNDRHLICLGGNEFGTTASPSGTFNPMIVRWSNQEDLTNWVPSINSTSGEVILTDGTEIVGAVRSRNAISIWTDNSLWNMTFVGPPFTFKFAQLGTNCGLIAPHAAVDYDGRAVWMGYDNFYAFDGQVRNLPCTVRRFVFDRLNIDQKDKIFCGINSEFKEVIWLYPSTNSEECDSYVVWSPDENYWSYGDSIFTTFADKHVFGNTITTGVTAAGNNLYNNEPNGLYTESGQPMSSFIESADFDMVDGNDIMFLSRVIPDFTLNDGALTFSIKTKDFPESNTAREKPIPPHSVTNNTTKIDMRARGRQGRVRVSCNSANTSWRWGNIRLAIQPDGKR